MHKLVKKFEFAILNQGMALGTFLDIEGAFDNVSFNAIERALESKCGSIQDSRPTRGSFRGSFCGSVCEFRGSFCEFPQKLPRFTHGNLHEISNKFLRNVTV